MSLSAFLLPGEKSATDQAIRHRIRGFSAAQLRDFIREAVDEGDDRFLADLQAALEHRERTGT